MIVVHHLHNSRSQRILWLLEELGLDYQMERYESPIPATALPRWAVLLRNTFAVDARECPRCGGRMRPVAVVTAPAAIETTLARLAHPRGP